LNNRFTLSERSLEFRDFIENYRQQQGFPPAIRDIMVGMEVRSTSTVKYHVDRLIRAGLVKHTPGKSRSLVVVRGAA
jgi:repressor LexA